MNVSGDVQGGGDGFKTFQSSALSFYSTGNLNYYYIIITCQLVDVQEIREFL